MSETSNTEDEKLGNSISKTNSFTARGLKYGLIAGLGLSVTYALLGVFAVYLVADIPLEAGLLLALVSLVVGSPLIVLLAIVPATLYGVFTGLILGGMIDRLGMQISKCAYVVLSVVMCLGIATVSHCILGIRPVWSFESISTLSSNSVSLAPFDSYLFWIGFPTIIYIATGGYVGRKLYCRMLEGEAKT